MKAIRVSPKSRAAFAEEMRRSPNNRRTAVSTRSCRRRSRAFSSGVPSETGISISIFTATPIIQAVDEIEDAEASDFIPNPLVSKRIENRRFRVLAGICLGRRGSGVQIAPPRPLKTSPLFARAGSRPASAPVAACGVLGFLGALGSYKFDYIRLGSFCHLLRTVAGRAQCGPVVFQSPSRRGRHFYLPEPHAAGPVAHISVPFAKGTALLPGAQGLVGVQGPQFQSPSRRGRHFYEEPSPKAQGNRNFSPLREGDGTSTGPGTTLAAFNSKFQSPSRRGRHFYHRRNAHRKTFPEFQSPSRRGRHFYRLSGAAVVFDSRHFSPLREGDGTSTGQHRRGGPHRRVFQSPSRRGRHFYANRRSRRRRRSVHFSPLREGDGTSTQNGTSEKPPPWDFSPLREGDGTSTVLAELRGEAFLEFQSPSRRGRHFYYRMRITRDAILWISVPFAKGTALLRRLPRVALRKPANFSPLREGDGTSTIQTQLTGKQASLFQSPSRRGRHFYDDLGTTAHEILQISVPFAKGTALLRTVTNRA